MTVYDNLTERDLLLSAWQTLRRIESAIGARIELPALQVTVDPPDLTDIVTAVQSLNGTPGPSAEDIARAIADVLAPARPDDGGEALRAVAEGLKMLDHRLQGMGRQAYGGGSVTLLPNQSVGIAGGVEIANDVGNPIPVSGTFFQATQPVSGTITANLGTIDGAATETTLALLPSKTDKFKYRTDTYTTTASGTAVDVTAYPIGYFAAQVKGTGAAATTWDIRLEGSLDGTNYSQILQHTNTTGDGAVLWSGAANSVSRYFRSRVAGLTLGSATNVVVSILGKGV